MAKKKNKKTQKKEVVDVTTPPDSPKTTPEDPAPAPPGSSPLSTEAVSTEPTQDEAVKPSEDEPKAEEASVEAPEPPVEAPEPPVEAPAPVEAPEPPVEAPEPPAETPEPPVEAPDAPEPPSGGTEPPVEAPEPPTEAPEPPVEASEPPVEAPEPPAEEAPASVESAESSEKPEQSSAPDDAPARAPSVTGSEASESMLASEPSKKSEIKVEVVPIPDPDPEPVSILPDAPEPPTEPEAEKAPEESAASEGTADETSEAASAVTAPTQPLVSEPEEPQAKEADVVAEPSAVESEAVEAPVQSEPEAEPASESAQAAPEPEPASEPEATAVPATVADPEPEQTEKPVAEAEPARELTPPPEPEKEPTPAPVEAPTPPPETSEASDAPPEPLKSSPPSAPKQAPTPPPEPERAATPAPEPKAKTIAASQPEPIVTEAAPVAPEQLPSSPRSVSTAVPRAGPQVASSRPRSPPKPEAVSQAIDDSRPPAPTPPISKVRPRHTSAFDDDDDDDSALIHSRRRGGTPSRDPSRGSSYPPQSSHHGSLFASRVPVEHYPNPPPPPPPGYHPRYYQPSAPPYYHNHSSAHSMSQVGGYSNASHYGPPSHVSSPYQESWGQLPPTYPPYGSPPQRHDSLATRGDYTVGPVENGSAIDEDHDVFYRIAQAIPDLHVLLARYKETHGQLGVREELLRRASAEQQEKLKLKDDEITSLNERIGKLENSHSKEASRLRFEIGNLEEQVKELREQVAETEKYKKEAEDVKNTLVSAMASWEAKYKELEEAHFVLEKTAAEEKAKAIKEFEEWRTTATTKHDAEKIALAIQFDKKLKEADVIAENQRQEAAAAFVREKDELRSEHQRQQRERESSMERVRKEIEGKLSTAQKDREEALRRERESRELWEEEREALSRAHQEDCDNLQKGYEEQREYLESQFRKQKEESDKAWIELHTEASKKAEEEKERADQLTKEKDDLSVKYSELREENEKEKQVIKSVASNLESEKARLEKLMECYGDIAEIKSKGDTYYLVSFSQLQRQIMDLAVTHFVHLPVTPPVEDLEQIPPGMPSFLGDTPASRQLRAAYIAHTVSKLVTYRVFGPFLFSLGRRFDKADSLFQSMSNHIRDKSTRKEAIWRQQTLLAAFTSSGAKQRINTAAGTVVEEIVNAIKNFADPREEEGIKIAVKRIVKLAAETWRFARLEREVITATMPALTDEEHQFTGPEFWPAHASKADGTMIPSLVGGTEIADSQPTILLRLFPVIHREPKHERFHEKGEKRDEGCIFHHGLALYDDAEPVSARAEELRSAGLPPVTSVSATAADFPPPVVPPPRNPPPPAPESSEKAVSEKARSMRSSKRSSRGASEKAPSDKAASPPLSPHDPPEPTHPPPPPPCPTEPPPPVPSDASSTPKEPPSKRSSASYFRRVDGPISVARRDGPAFPITDSIVHSPAMPSYVSEIPNLPTDSILLPVLAAELDSRRNLPQPSPIESAILPQEPPLRDEGPPTPPLSRDASPPRSASPLFEVIDEIDALSSHRSRKQSVSRPRSTRSKTSIDETPKDRSDRGEHTLRRTSGYTLHSRHSMEGSQRSEGTHKSTNSRYKCESRSAAIKGLYPNSPLAGQSAEPPRKESLSSSSKHKRKSFSEVSKPFSDSGTWDTNSSMTSLEGNLEPSTLD
ncbi:hypothetical protein BS50DRAFT_591302 [Corynespora cassiicola Philippines]|uniref:Uncharacterized protein n=1 Tax=Corynespora cassiicola Philippines TaxID=1448308 RepID=A0A2T2NCJ0_CORCC|nr:hypothetical protein BS50DRAFT_591302 [Corynespora cassiicola Philippines]